MSQIYQLNNAVFPPGTVVQTLTPDSGVSPVVPTAGNTINVLGGVLCETVGSLNTITIDVDDAVAAQYDCDSGSAVPVANVLNILGDTEITETTGAGNTVTATLTNNAATTAVYSFNGAILEDPSFSVTSDGATITFSIERSGGGDLTVVFSDGFYAWDTTPAATVTLTAGTDTVPVENFVYLLQGTKTLTASTSGWPATEHAALARVICQSAVSLQTQGAYAIQGCITDVIEGNNQGHMYDIDYWIRSQNATWVSGVAPTVNITTNIGTPDNVIFTSTAGTILQLHPEAFPAFAGTPDIYVVNDSVTPYTVVTDLNQILTDASGGSLVGRFFNLVIWGVISPDAADCKLFCNLPTGSYANATSLADDSLNFGVFSIPNAYKGTGFLIANILLRQQASSGGTWTLLELRDLRGLIPLATASGTTTVFNEFPDSVFRIFDNLDDTKKIAFEASSITTATTRTLTAQDADGTIALSNVANYGTGATSFTAYGVVCGGTTATNPLQSVASVGTSGQLLTSNGAGALPTFQDSVPDFTWQVDTGVATNMVTLNGYIANNAGQTVFTLPAVAAVGDTFRVTGMNNATGWKIAQNAGQTIHFGASNTTTGATGYLESTATYDAVELVCNVANTDFIVLSSIGNITIN